MAEIDPVDAGQQTTNAPTNLALSRDSEFRTLSARLDEVASQISKIEKPATWRVSDYVQLAFIGIAVLVAIFTALGLSTRIDDLRKGQGETETRVTGQITATEARLGSRLDRLNDQFVRVDERTSTLEGQRDKKYSLS